MVGGKEKKNNETLECWVPRYVAEVSLGSGAVAVEKALGAFILLG